MGWGKIGKNIMMYARYHRYDRMLVQIRRGRMYRKVNAKPRAKEQKEERRNNGVIPK
jgi:hypothetical protein